MRRERIKKKFKWLYQSFRGTPMTMMIRSTSCNPNPDSLFLLLFPLFYRHLRLSSSLYLSRQPLALWSFLLSAVPLLSLQPQIFSHHPLCFLSLKVVLPSSCSRTFPRFLSLLQIFAAVTYSPKNLSQSCASSFLFIWESSS